MSDSPAKSEPVKPERAKKPPRLSSGVVVCRLTDSGLLFLLLRAFNHWDFPKGMVEQGETPFEAAVREVNEETTIDDLTFPWGDEYTETGPYSKNKVARYYIGRTETAKVEILINPDLGRAEHSEYRWVTVAEARQLVAPRVDRVIDWALTQLPADMVSKLS